MTDTTTTEAVQALLESVTPGPWAWEESHPTNACAEVTAEIDGGWPSSIATLYGSSDLVPPPTEPDEPWGDHPIRRANARFIAAARDLVPALLKERDEALAQLARREEMHDCTMKERDDATLYADEQKARADRAEASLAALEPARHVNETPKSEHDSADMLIATPYAVTLAEDAITEGETASQMLDRLGMDGAKWAAEFRTTALRLGYSDMDEGWLIGWFCNAIMAGHDRAQSPDATLEPAPVTLADALQVPEVRALVEAACGLLDAYSAIVGTGNPWGDSLRAALRAFEGDKA